MTQAPRPVRVAGSSTKNRWSVREQAAIQNCLGKPEGSRRTVGVKLDAFRIPNDRARDENFPRNRRKLEHRSSRHDHRRGNGETKRIAALHRHRPRRLPMAFPALATAGMRGLADAFQGGQRAMVRRRDPRDRNDRHKKRGNPPGLAEKDHDPMHTPVQGLWQGVRRSDATAAGPPAPAWRQRRPAT